MAKSEKAINSVPHKMVSVQIHMDDEGYSERLSDETSETPFQFALESQRLIRSLVQQQVDAHLGEQYEVVDFEVSEGSILITFAIAKSIAFFASPAGQLVLDVSRYEAFIKSITLIVAQSTKAIKALMGFRFGRITTTSSFQVNPAMIATPNPLQALPTAPDLNMMVLTYLVISHAALLILFGWLLVRHLR